MTGPSGSPFHSAATSADVSKLLGEAAAAPVAAAGTVYAVLHSRSALPSSQSRPIRVCSSVGPSRRAPELEVDEWNCMSALAYIRLPMVAAAARARRQTG